MVWAPGAQNEVGKVILWDSSGGKSLISPHLSSRGLPLAYVQFPPPPPKFSRKFGSFSQNPQGGSGRGSGFFANRCLSQGLWTSRDKRPEEVLPDVPAVALLDHLHRCPAVFSKPFQIGSLRKRPRDERVSRCVELPRPDPEAAKTPKPDTLRRVVDRSSCRSSLRPPGVRHRLPFRAEEDELRAIGMKSPGQSLQKIDDPGERRNLASRTSCLGRVILALVAASRY